MKKLGLIFISFILISGCATYKIQEGKDGFVVSRYKKVIPEYTVGSDNSFPDQEVAGERFKRRKNTVEYYYKKMGFIDNRFKQVFIEPPVAFLQFIVGIFRMPFIAIADYKYNHNPQYKAKVDRIEDEQYQAEKERVKKFKEGLAEYIKEDLSKEPYPEADKKVKLKRKVKEVPVKPKAEAVKPHEVTPLASEPEVVMPITAPEEAVKPQPSVIKEVKPEKIKPKAMTQSPSAVIIAKPQSGPSPLKVNFYGTKSRSPNGSIIAYEWDFGDGDKSNKPNPSNTYWSTTYGVREFLVTLTVTDKKGISSSASAVIKVVNK
ncbi:MAG: PKD domain-containing protein [Candidatus Omnitrophica bacterium]|nr:PKD domain-containing protein [Candidatus Omnitrophota bacterium]